MKKIYFLLIALTLLSAKNYGQNNGLTSYSCTLNGINPSTFSLRTAFAIDNNGNKWVGFNSAYPGKPYELVRFNGTTWDSLPHVPSHKVNALAVDPNNNLWIGTDSGLVMYNGSSYTVYNTGNSNITSNVINCIAVGNGKIYTGTNGGLCIFNGSNFTNYTHAINGLSHDTIYSITYENPTAIWLGNIGGLEKFYGSGFSYYYNLGGIGSDKVNCIYVDQQNNKWLGTNSYGVVKFDNLYFYTMQQLYGQYAIVGGIWPDRTYSICKGPNGGISFTVNHNNYTFYSCEGLVEIVNGAISFYKGVGFYSNQGFNPYSIFLHDVGSNEIFYVNTRQGAPRTFLYSFDESQYNSSINITKANSDYLDINNVAALITENADMGWDGGSTKYFVPKTQNSSPLKGAALWIGGYNNGALHLGAMTYRQNGMDFWPGPLDTITGKCDSITSLNYNKVWKVNRFDIANFIYNWNTGNVQNGTFYPANSILTWPAHGTGNFSRRLAPFVDVNNNGIYDPIHDGDYPLIKGDQMIWTVFNDNTYKHRETGAMPMGIEVHASAYAYVCPNIADSNRVLNYTTFYNYEIINRSQNTYDSCIISNWVNGDLGNYQDDYIGCDVMNNYGYIFNGDNYDEDYSGMTGYHSNLPVFSCNILSGPDADLNDGVDNNNNGIIDEPNEKCMMRTFDYYTNTGSPETGNPTAAQQYYNFMNGIWRDGTRITYGGSGLIQTNQTCHHLFPGNSDPYGISMGGSITNPIPPPGNFGTSGWTQQQAGVVKADMRFLTGVGHFTMQPAGKYNFDYAFVFSQDSANCDSNAVCVLGRAQQDNIRVKNWFNANTFPSCLSLNGVGIQENGKPQLDVKVYPNPASNYVYIEVVDAKDKITIEIFDMLGNLVKAGTFSNSQKYITIPVEDLSKGLYSVRIKAENVLAVRKFVKE